MAMAPLGAAICGVSKALSNSRWDHVGVVVRKDDGNLYLLEANLSGVTLRPLEERLRRSRSNEIALRRLSIVRNDQPGGDAVQRDSPGRQAGARAAACAAGEQAGTARRGGARAARRGADGVPEAIAARRAQVPVAIGGEDRRAAASTAGGSQGHSLRGHQRPQPGVLFRAGGGGVSAARAAGRVPAGRQLLAEGFQHRADEPTGAASAEQCTPEPRGVYPQTARR
eukprot:ctg_5047.g594